MSEQGSQPPALLRFLDDQVTKNGYLKVIWAPLAVLAAIGGAFALLDENWWVLGTVGGCGTLALVLLLLAVERQRSTTLKQRVDGLEPRVEQHETQLKRLQD